MSGPHFAGPPRRDNTVRNVLLIILALVVLAFGGCAAMGIGTGLKVRNEVNKKSVVTMEVTGTSGRVTVNFTGGPMTTEEAETGVALPWTKTVKVKTGMMEPTIFTARNAPGETGSVTCTLRMDGGIVMSNTAEGPNAEANCNYLN